MSIAKEKWRISTLKRGKNYLVILYKTGPGANFANFVKHLTGVEIKIPTLDADVHIFTL